MFVIVITNIGSIEKKPIKGESINQISMNYMSMDEDQKLYERDCPNRGGTYLVCLYKEGSECSSLDETYCG